MEVNEWNGTDGSNALLGSITVGENLFNVDKTNDAIRAIMGAVRRQLGTLNVQSANIASASTTNLATATGQFVSVTGTTNITGFGTVTAGQVFYLRFSGVLTLTYNATSMILPTAASIITAANDVAVMVSLGSGNWACIAYTKANGQAPANAIASTDNAVSRFNGTTGDLQNSVVIIGDTGAVSGVTTLAVGGAVTGVTTLTASGQINSEGIDAGAAVISSAGAISGVTTLVTSGNVTVGGTLTVG